MQIIHHFKPVLRIGLSVLIVALAACSSTSHTTTAPATAATAAPTNTLEVRYKRIANAMNELVTGGRVTNVNWSEDGSFVTFNRDKKRVTFDLEARAVVPAPAQTQPTTADDEPRSGRRGGRRGGAAPARGRQRERETSPDGQWVAISHDWNVIIEPAEKEDDDDAKAEPIAVTTDGNSKFRYGTASWVYGEELDQTDAMWWSPDSSKLAFYEFDERKVPDHYITAGLTDLHTHVLTEGYPKPGEPNPIANLLIYDLATKSTTRVEGMDEGEWYTYAVQWSPNGESLLFNRTNRHQSVLHVMATDPGSGATRIVVTETQDTWQNNRPLMDFLDDGRRFIWESEKTGWKQYELRDLDGTSICTFTHGEYPVAGVEKIDEKHNVLYYMVYSEPSCPLSAQLHRVNLDGSGGRRLTREPLNHNVQMSPDGEWFITVCEAVDKPPKSILYRSDGERITTLAQSDRTRFDAMSLSMPELFTFKADDGQTDLYGVLYKPSHFNAKKKYPLVIDVYGGPSSQGVRNRFNPASAACEYGFLIARVDNRGTTNRGKAFESATYLRLGEKDLQDQADGVKFLAKRPYVDASRVGIFGHSYGGYMSALALLKFPEVFHVGVAGAPVTHWKNYDTIYTERYMRTPQENPDGYEVGSCLKFAENLKGNLLIVHGLIDDNVHPNNTWQLIDLFEKADLPVELMVYPNADHGIGGNYSALRWRYLREHLLGERASSN